MGSSAQVHESSASIDSAAFSFNKIVDIVQLILAIAKHFLQILLWNLQSVEGLFFFEDLCGFSIQ